MASDPTLAQEPIRFGEGYELDLRLRRLRCSRYLIKLERIPLDILALLVQNAGRIVSRDEIIETVWGKDVFLDTDNSIRGAIRKLRHALKDDADNPRFIQTVTGQGYRFIALVASPHKPDRTDAAKPETSAIPIPEPAPVAHPDPSSLPTKATAGKRITAKPAGQNRHVSKWLIVAAVALLAFAAFAAYRFTPPRSPRPDFPRITSLAVLPLKNLSGDPQQDYFADGMTEEVIGRLAMIHGLRVISRTSVMQFKNSSLLAPQIARMLGVDALVEGSVIREGNRIRVHAQLIRASTDEHFWSETYDRELGDALTLESEVAASIAQRVEATVTGDERARLVAARPVPPDVYESYLKGIAGNDNNRAEVEKRIAYFNQAIARDPTFAPAYVGLAEAYGMLGTILVGAPPSETRPKVISYARKALEIDPELAQAHIQLALMDESEWRWADAETEFHRALALNPNLAAAHFGLADWLLCHGRVDEALAWGRSGRELDPLGPFIGTTVWGLLNARRYHEAILEARNVLAVRPDEPNTLWNLGWALVFNRQPNDAIPVLEKAASITDRSPGILCTLVWAYARSGRRAEALRIVEELEKRQRTGYVPAGALLNSYLGLGDKDAAFAWFERATEEHSNVLKYIKVFPAFDEVRDDPRFQELVRRVGLDGA